MEVLLSAVLGDLTTRAISFFTSGSSKPQLPDLEDQLCRVLLRAQVIVDEAMGRHITNQAMLLQLQRLREVMHQCYYMLDTFGYQSHDKEDIRGQPVSHSCYRTRISSLKGFSFSSRNTPILKQLQDALDNLSSMILDCKELVIFLTSYPRLYHQPYSMHLQLGNCMFGREMELERITNYLLCTQPPGAEELEVLPIVGPGKIGKSTLVAHVCRLERVRDRFSEIVFLSDRDFTDDKLSTFTQGCAGKHQNSTLKSSNDGLFLVVIELVGNLSEDAWNRLYSSYKQYMPRGSKIILTSRSDKIVKFGTTGALTLKCLSHEAYWYLFKTLTFGSMDPEMHPRLVHLAMEIARTLNGSLLSANFTAGLLRDKISIPFWRKILTTSREYIQKHLSMFGVHPLDLLHQDKPVQLGKMAQPSNDFVVHHQYQCSLHEDVPKIMMQDVIYGRVKKHGKFEALVWKSRIPPYYTFVNSCEIRELKTKASKRKRST